MQIGLSFLLVITGLIEFILWSVGKVPYGALCWVVPLVCGIIFAIIKQLCD